MSDRIKKIKIKQADGTMSGYYPIGADAQNIDFSNGFNLDNIVGSINPDESGNIATQLSKSIKYYDCVADMKADTTLNGGGAARTLGYYEPGDGGGGLYQITETSSDLTVALNNGLYAELYIDGEMNVKQLGAYGDDEHDDTDIIQFAIDYAYDNDIKNVFFEAGEYKVTKPIFIYDQIALYGKNSNSSHIHKTTHTKLTIPDYEYDVILFLINRSLNIEDSGSVLNVKIHDLWIRGCTTTYTADKAEEDMQYAIKAVSNMPKTQISDFLIRDVDVGINAKGLWTGWIKNCTCLQSYYRAIYIEGDTQGLNIANINTEGTHDCGIYVRGSAYSTLSDILVEWIYGGTAFDIGYWSGDILNCGYELGTGPLIGFKFISAKARVTGAYGASPSEEREDACCFRLNNSIVKVENSNFGTSALTTPYKGRFLILGNQSHFIIGEGVNISKGFTEDWKDTDSGTSSAGNSFITIKNKTFFSKSLRYPSLTFGASRKTPQEETYIDTELNSAATGGKIKHINLFYDFINTPSKTSTMADLQWQPFFNKGDIGFINNSTKNGKAAWICNRNNKFDTTVSVGVITNAVSRSTYFRYASFRKWWKYWY